MRCTWQGGIAWHRMRREASVNLRAWARGTEQDAGGWGGPAGCGALARCREEQGGARLSATREIGRKDSATQVGDFWISGRCESGAERREGHAAEKAAWLRRSGRSIGSEEAVGAMLVGSVNVWQILVLVFCYYLVENGGLNEADFPRGGATLTRPKCTAGMTVLSAGVATTPL